MTVQLHYIPSSEIDIPKVVDIYYDTNGQIHYWSNTSSNATTMTPTETYTVKDIVIYILNYFGYPDTIYCNNGKRNIPIEALVEDIDQLATKLSNFFTSGDYRTMSGGYDTHGPD